MLNCGPRAAIVLLLILGQCYAVLHAAEFGSETHSHDGVVCIAILSEEEHAPILPSSVDSLGVSSGTELEPTLVSPAAVAFVRKAWPPQTGPPSGA